MFILVNTYKRFYLIKKGNYIFSDLGRPRNKKWEL